MPLQLPFGDQDQFFLTATLGGKPLTALPTGQTAKVESSDPATVTAVLDATAVPDPDGTPSVASGVVASAATPVQPNVPITLTVTLNNADGSVAATATDTITVTEAVTEAVGVLFGTPVAIPKAAVPKV